MGTVEYLHYYDQRGQPIYGPSPKGRAYFPVHHNEFNGQADKAERQDLRAEQKGERQDVRSHYKDQRKDAKADQDAEIDELNKKFQEDKKGMTG